MNAILLLVLLAPAPADTKDDPKAQKAALDKLQGIWKLTALESRGQAMPVERIARSDRYTLVVSGDNYVLLTHAGTVKLDPAKKFVDLVISEGRYKGTSSLGIYELSGDKLKIALRAVMRTDAERPKEFKSGEDGNYAVYEFERQSSKKEDTEAKLKELRETVARQPSGTPFAPADRTTQDLLRQIIERLDRIEKRLDAMEKKTAPPEKK
jgi:uncharacterized protein (TIGR03067 family)